MGRPPDVVVVDHHDSYTWNLVHLIAGVTGVLPSVVEHDECEPADVLRHEYVVLSPGPGHPADPHDFAVGREVLLDGSRPVLGVCLGMQGMVTAYGGVVDRVVPAHGEVAVVRHDARGIFRGLPAELRAVRYHSLAAVRLPECLEATAWCRADAGGVAGAGRGGEVGEVGGHGGGGEVVMGVRHLDRPQQGVQFHPESVLSERGAAMVANFLS